MSLKSALKQIVIDRGGLVVSLEEITSFCDKAKYKVSNAERRFREFRDPGHKDFDPQIAPVWNDNKTAIIGYKLEGGRNIVHHVFPSKTIPEKKYDTVDLRTGWACNCPRYQYTADCSHIRTLKTAMKIA